MDWKFTLAALILFPSLHRAHSNFWQPRPPSGAAASRKTWDKMVVTMQETFAGIRVVKSFAREEHQVKSFSRSTMLQFRNVMRMIKSTELTGPLIEILAAMGVGWALLYVYVANLSAGRFLALIGGIFILYDPVKTLSKMHIVMQRSIAATVGIFGILDTPSAIQDSPDAQNLDSCDGRIDFQNVTFRYTGTSTDAVKNLNSPHRAGQKLRARGRERRR